MKNFALKCLQRCIDFSGAACLENLILPTLPQLLYFIQWEDSDNIDVASNDTASCASLKKKRKRSKTLSVYASLFWFLFYCLSRNDTVLLKNAESQVAGKVSIVSQQINSILFSVHLELYNLFSFMWVCYYFSLIMVFSQSPGNYEGGMIPWAFQSELQNTICSILLVAQSRFPFSYISSLCRFFYFHPALFQLFLSSTINRPNEGCIFGEPDYRLCLYQTLQIMVLSSSRSTLSSPSFLSLAIQIFRSGYSDPSSDVRRLSQVLHLF